MASISSSSTAKSLSLTAPAIRFSSAASILPANTSPAPPDHQYRCGVLLDMVGDAQLQIYREVNSMRTRRSGSSSNDIWGNRPRPRRPRVSLRPRARNPRRPPRPQRHRQYPHHRHHRLRLSQLPRRRATGTRPRRAGKMLPRFAGQGRLGAEDVARAAEMHSRSVRVLWDPTFCRPKWKSPKPTLESRWFI